MKKKTLIIINSLLATLISLLGCGVPDERENYIEALYGVPYATSMVEGTITDENDEPLENIQVTIMETEYREFFLQHDGFPSDEIPPEFVCYTNESGFYEWNSSDYYCDSLSIIVQDTSGVYAADSVRTKMKYNRSGVPANAPLDQGKGFVQQDFQLKKK